MPETHSSCVSFLGGGDALAAATAFSVVWASFACSSSLLRLRLMACRREGNPIRTQEIEFWGGNFRFDFRKTQLLWRSGSSLCFTRWCSPSLPDSTCWTDNCLIDHGVRYDFLAFIFEIITTVIKIKEVEVSMSIWPHVTLLTHITPRDDGYVFWWIIFCSKSRYMCIIDTQQGFANEYSRFLYRCILHTQEFGQGEKEQITEQKANGWTEEETANIGTQWKLKERNTKS